MHILVAIILGFVEGITEFLPISSTGHVIVAEKLLGYRDIQDMFTVVVQLGAILAVIWFFWKDLWAKVIGLFKWDAKSVHFWKLLVLATIPAGFIGLLLNDTLTNIATPLVVAISMIIGGIIILLVDNKPVPRRDEQQAKIASISFKRALIVGLGQSLAIIPGVSRSGATIITGLLTGLNRPTATAFSFYLSIPVLILASGLKLVKDGHTLGQLPGGGVALLAGMITAFVTALISIRWLLHYIAHHNFKPFGIYRICAGALILVLLAAGWL